MASTYKTFLSDDVTNTRTLLHEAIPLTGSVINGATYTSQAGTETNIKTYAHGMFQSVYDYPYTSSSANHIFDVTLGHHPDILTQGILDNDVIDAAGVNILNGGSTNAFYSKRKNIYNQMAQVLAGNRPDGEIKKFDMDGDLTGGDKYNSLIFVNFARLLGKDEIKKSSFSLTLGTGTTHGTATDAANGEVVITDAHASTNYKIDSPAGEYATLKVASVSGTNTATGKVGTNCGLIYYQAGVVVLSPEIFMHEQGANSSTGLLDTGEAAFAGQPDAYAAIANLSQDAFLTAFRNRILDISFSNTTELNSTIYFCRVGHNDFNYSTNPTYLKSSKIRVKETSKDTPISYITTVGLYSSDNELLAVAKLSEPLRKDPTNDLTLRVRLDY